MNNVIEAAENTGLKDRGEYRCPYINLLDICTASINLIAVTQHTKTVFCGTESYDNCPIFLSKVLRGR